MLKGGGTGDIGDVNVADCERIRGHNRIDCTSNKCRCSTGSGARHDGACPGRCPRRHCGACSSTTNAASCNDATFDPRGNAAGGNDDCALNRDATLYDNFACTTCSRADTRTYKR